LVEELIALRREVTELKTISYQTTVNTHNIVKDIRRWDYDGLPPFRDPISLDGSSGGSVPGYSTFNVPD